MRAVVHEFYDVKVDGHEVLLNNVAFLKCVVPLHIREYVEITTWYRGEETLTDNSDISKYGLDFLPSSPINRKKVASIIKSNLRETKLPVNVCAVWGENN